MNFLEREHNIFFQTYKRLPLEVVKGEGCYLFTKDGKKYLDMFAGLAVNALGYAHPAITHAIAEQASKYTHLSNYFLQEPQIELAELLIHNSSFKRIFFSNSGTEAIEGTIKLVRKWGSNKGKKNIFGMSNGFSGRSMGALSLMDKEKYREGYGPFLENFGSIEFNNVHDLKSKVNAETAAVFLEFIQGEGGIVGVTKEFIETLTALRDEYGFLVVADEIQSGIGRTGKLFAFEQFNFHPDVVTIAKPIGGGLPLGAILGNEKVENVWTYGVHGTTFGGNPVACAAGIAVIKTILNNQLMNHVRETSQWFKEQLINLKHPSIKEIRCYGFMIGIELHSESAPVAEAMLALGVLVNATANTVIRILPPLIAGKKEFEILLNALKQTIK
ncbi:MAG: acetylornithine/succinylornithine family transaminase [Bacteroidetes bacterium]|nr:acetylornithine/succinylornithine family transaminase [Bacteroidota bacterium]